MNERRCFDCLAEFNDEPRFVVLKKMRDVSPEADPTDRWAFLESLCYDEVFVCGDCAGWYGDDVFAVDDDDALFDAKHEANMNAVLTEQDKRADRG